MTQSSQTFAELFSISEAWFRDALTIFFEAYFFGGFGQQSLVFTHVLLRLHLVFRFGGVTGARVLAADLARLVRRSLLLLSM